MNRRDFVILTVAACAGCSADQSSTSGPPEKKVIDAGPASLYDANGIYDHYRHQGFFLVRNGASLVALSSDCTHRECPLRALPDRTLSCRCHGSRFNEEGIVLHGPAVRRLPQYSTSVNENQHLLVEVTRGKFDEE